MKKIAFVAGGALLAVVFPAFLHASGTVVEEIVARVNNDIITLSQYQKAEASLHQDAAQSCQGCSEDKINDLVADEKKNLLRDMIDQSLMVQRAKDLNIDVDTEVIKQLDEIRQQNNLPSMDALQKAVESEGVSWEDYKQQFKDHLLTQKVVQQEVGPTASKIGSGEVQKYYQTHQSQFVKPEEVDLSEIFLSTENKTPEQAAAVKEKAEAIEKRIKAGEDFGALAKRFSEDSAASVDGEVGEFQRTTMAPDVEKAVFSLKRGDSTDVMEVHNGFEIYHVNQRFEAGLQPLNKVEDEIESILYQSRIQPAMQKYYTQLRRDSYIITAPGYIDTGAVAGNSVIQEVPFSSDKAKEKKKKTPKTAADDNEDGNP